jgi:hypothetical protein
MHAALQEQFAESKLLGAMHATWMQAAVNRGAGAIMGGKADWLRVWDLVPELEPGFHRRKRQEAAEKRNRERWAQAARFLGGV